MKILYSWLKEFVDTRLSSAEIQDALTMAGIEVSSCRFLGEGLENVVVAKILAQGQHPNADKLSLCRVTDGSSEYGIVCGARNMNPGDVVALARIGAKLPNGVEIRKAKIRGEVSEGMLCSEMELRLSEESAGILILPPETPVGKPMADALGLSDWMLEVEITPNRGDCLSVLGVAREVAAITGVKVRLPSVDLRENGPAISDAASVSVTDAELCPRYSARVITDVTVAPSPLFLRRRLALCGIRPINNIVDITNYLLLELGQPMHAFDLDRLAGGTIGVRRSGVPRKFTTLDGGERDILPEMLLIWDGEGPVAVAGVMGGRNTEVLPTTRRVLFESAHFAPASIRRTSRRLGLSSESSYRFERGVDPGGTMYAADRAVSLFSRFSSFSVARGSFDVGGGKDFSRTVTFRPARASRIMGREYTEKECGEVFSRLDFAVRKEEPGRWSVTVPPHRFDIEREIDLVEEVARITGYEEIPVTYPESGAPDFSPDDRFAKLVEDASEFLRMHGFNQAINFSFVSEKEWERYAALLAFDSSDAIRLENPISEDTTMMRPHLLMGLLHNVASNVRRFIEDVRLFEVGKAFGKSLTEGHFEEPRLGFVLYGRRLPGNWSGGQAAVDFYDAKAVASSLTEFLGAAPFHFIPAESRPFLETGVAAEILKDGENVGWVGAVRRELAQALDIPGIVYYGEIRIGAATAVNPPAAQYRAMPKFPPVFRDIACILPVHVPVGDVLAMVSELSEEIESAAVFDIYMGEKIGEGNKSVAFRVKIQPPDRTLTDAEVNSIHTKIVKLLENRFGGKIRAS
ncbi:MAG: phenylalanine--tRNA ligase subunit beta [Deltaproteobacteria bacterium RBG_19FT_COMBO_60_16]|nr:MAG: phenylalanine--tRNA ligase subunit beta [Deltaproteobacteria bacterium RBG_16_64_85]OGP99910.1 MAG: phenylalanine--tRNA ligase subunit beta [Deltaproteobacteria bacterium RBG_19FT_COMBO_60_16]